jgi:hypothetical protein
MSERLFITIPLFAAAQVAARHVKDDRPWDEPKPITPGSQVIHGSTGWLGKVEKLNTGASAPNAAAYIEWLNGPSKGEKAWVGLSYLHTPVPQSDFGFDHQPDGIHVSARVKTAISLPELVRETNAFSKKYRPGCSPKLLDSNPKALFLHYNVKCNKEDSDPAGHDVRVQFDITKVQESQQAKDLDLQVSCSCPAFLYWGAQWNLHMRDGLLGTPRPQLTAPTDRLDLRGNFVICKHLHAVFERILPSVQHNIVKILRDREVQRNKEKMKETPERLKEKQDEMKRKKELDKIHKEKDKDIQDKMVDSLKSEEQARLLHEQQLKNQGAPGPLEDEEEVTQDTLPAEGITELPPESEDIHALEELAQQEEDKIKEQHKEHTPHEHKGLPYEIHDEDEDEGWQGARVSHTAARLDWIARGARVRLRNDLMIRPEPEGTIEQVIIKDKKYHDADVVVRWDDGETTTVTSYQLALAPKKQQNLFGSVAKIAMRYEDIKKGMQVVYIPSISNGERQEGVVVRVNKPEAGDRSPHLRPLISVRWNNGGESDVAAWTVGNNSPQKPLFLEPLFSALQGDLLWKDIKEGQRVKWLNLDTQELQYGTVIDKGEDNWTPVLVKWDSGETQDIPANQLHKSKDQKTLYFQGDGEWV